MLSWLDGRIRLSPRSSRSLKSDGDALRYTEEKPADQFGVLPEGQFDESEMTKPEYGKLNEISRCLFDSVWDRVETRN